MIDTDIRELAAILVNEHGHAALRIAETRRDQHRHDPNSDAYLLWDAIAAAVARLLARRDTERPQVSCQAAD